MALIAVLVAFAPLVAAGTATIGSPITDFGDDTNGNGLFDELVVLVPLDVTVPGNFMLSVMLYDSSGFTFITSNAAYFSLAASSTIGIGLDGMAIRQAGFDGPYQANIELYDPDTGWVLIDSAVYTTNAYNASQFEQTPILFAPPHSDSAIDLDSNGLYDILEVDVNVNVYAEGTYIISGYVQDPSYVYQDTASVTLSLPAGAAQILLNYSGWGIRAAGVDGPYTVWLTAEDLGYKPLASDTHTTQPYSAASFELPPGVLAPPYSDHGVDTDGDGLYDAIAVDVPVVVNTPATFSAIVNLMDSSGVNGLANGFATANLDVGPQTLEVEVPTLSIVKSGVDGPYQVDIILWADDPHTGSSPTIGTGTAMTGAYSVDQFDGIPATLGSCTDRAIDRDTPPDGYYDVLAVNVTVNVTESGPYLVGGTLLDSGMQAITYDNIYVPDGTGNFTVTLNFPGVDVRNSGVSGPLEVQVYLATYMNSNYVQMGYESFTTASYNASDFAYAGPALLDGHLYDAASGDPLAAIGIEAFNYRWLKEMFTLTDANGYYAFPAEEGTWVVTPEPYEFNEQVVAQVNVTGPETPLDFDLPAVVPQLAYVNLSFADWSHAERDRDWIFSYMGETARQYYDWWFGNRDGYMTAEEYNASLAWPSSVPPPLPAVSADLFRVDGSPFGLMPDSNNYTVSDIAGSIFDPRPMIGLETGAYANTSAPLPGDTHSVDVNVSYDMYWNNRIYRVSLPTGYLAQDVTAPPDFLISGLGTGNVTIDPPLPADPNDLTASAWVTIEAALPDVTAPDISAVSTSPASPELGVATTILASVSDAGGVDAVTIELTGPNNGVVGNFTMAPEGGNYAHTFTPSVLGTYSYTVYAVDLAGNGATFVGSFDVADTTPPSFASATATPTPQEIGGTVTFSAQLSDLSGVQSASVQIRGPTGNLLGNFTMAYSASTDVWTATRTFDVPGTYAYTVWATDGAGNVASSSGSLVMRDTTDPTLSGATATPDPVEIHGNVAFAVTATDLGGVASVKVEIRDSQGHLVGNYTMTAGSADTYTYSFAPSDLGTYSYRISAFDTSGNGRMVSGTFVVQDTTDPVASAGSDQTVVQGTTVTFNGTASTDNAAVSTYTWTFNDGGAKTLTGVSPTYTFANVGTFTVTLTVADASGNTATDTMTVTVTSLPPTTGSVSGTVSDASGVAIQGATVDLMSGSTKVATATTDAQGHFSFTSVNAGTYTLQVQATGYDPGSAQVTVIAGQTATSTVHLTVTATTPPQGGVDWLPILVIVVVVAAAAAGAFLYLRRRKA